MSLIKIIRKVDLIFLSSEIMVTFKDFLIKSKFNVNKAKIYQESYDKIMKSGLFDKNYYLKAYPHVEKSGMDPLFHYLFYGAGEHKNEKGRVPFFKVYYYY